MAKYFPQGLLLKLLVAIWKKLLQELSVLKGEMSLERRWEIFIKFCLNMKIVKINLCSKPYLKENHGSRVNFKTPKSTMISSFLSSEDLKTNILSKTRHLFCYPSSLFYVHLRTKFHYCVQKKSLFKWFEKLNFIL